MDSKHGIAVLVLALGLTTIVGSITGQMAPMLAALFEPDLLVNKSGNKAVAVAPSVGGKNLGSILLNPAGVAGGIANTVAGVVKKLIP